MSKIALIVGVTGGLGAACAEELAKDYTVIVSGRNKDKGDAIVSKITSGGGKAAFMAVDIKDEPSIAVLHKTVLAKYGRLDVAVNAAGILPPFLKLADTTKGVFDDAMAINVTGTYLCMVEQVRAMLKNPDKVGGQIVNFSSIYGLSGCKWGSIYSATKHALVGLTRSAAIEYAQDNIRINALAPGIIPTEMTAALDPTSMPDGEMKTDIINQVNNYAQRRFGEVGDCSRAVRYLVESPWVTGTVMEIDGGFGAGK